MRKFNTVSMQSFSCEMKVGEKILLSGVVYTARDAAHKKLHELMDQDAVLPFHLKDATIYYAGPTPTPQGMVIGSCGPTTSGRMDKYTPRLLDYGLKCMIGKGPRSPEVIQAIKNNKAIYLCAIGGTGALAARCIKEMEVIAFEELGCESIKRLVIKDFPLIVAIDVLGNNIFELGTPSSGGTRRRVLAETLRNKEKSCL